ncbi:MAG: aldehyde dehydrogenase family protein [Dermatophilaceae bacterium]
MRRARRAACRTLRVGDPLDKNTDVGAINSAAQLARIRELVAAGVEEGARAPPGRRATCRSAASGSRRRTSRSVAPAHRIAREEIFGPVLSVLTFRTPDEAVELANNDALRPLGGRLDGQGREGLRARAAGCGLAWSGRTRSTSSTRRRRSAACRESGYGREGGLAGLREYLA